MPGILVFTTCAPARADMTVYVVDGLTRVRPDDAPLVAPAIHVWSARNEYEPFQVVIRAGRDGLDDVNATISDFRADDGTIIQRENATLYREQYVRVTKGSPKSRQGAGWYPDALIPFVRPVKERKGGKSRFIGAPFDIEPNTNQPVWVDVYVPRDAERGVYHATLTVTADDQRAQTIAVGLTVWNITLPDTPSMRSSFGKLGTDIAKAHKVVMNSEEFLNPEWEYATALAAHRISPIIPNTIYPRVRDDGSIDTRRTHRGLTRWMETFHVTGFPLRLLGDDPAGKDRKRNVTHLRAMYKYLADNGWENTAYVYVLDEPEDADDYEEVRRRAQMIHDAQPGIEVLCTEQTKPDLAGLGSLVGYVDIWVPLWTSFDEASAAERLQAGEELWSYTALVQGRRGNDTPYWQMDFPLLDFRIPAWINWRYGITGLLYYSAVSWSRTSDVWTDPVTYRVGSDVYSGDGALFYPGVDAGIDGPIVSMRLKQIREGFEDYEYMKLLADRGDRKFAEDTVREIARSWTDWNPNPKALYDARGAMARYLVSGE